MEKFCKFSCHEYMDMYPHDHVRTFIAETEEGIRKAAAEYAQYMNENYSGGTTTFVCVMTKEQAKAHIDALIDEELRNADCSSEEWIKGIKELYNKCYETEN